SKPSVLLTWYYAGLALLAYRDGRFEQAADFSRKSLAINRRQGAEGALALLVLALAQLQSQQADQARRSLAEATALIPAELATLGSKDFKGPVPVSAAVVHHDWLIAEILRREAARELALWQRFPALLRGEDQPADNGERLAFARIASLRQHCAVAAWLWGEALARDPQLGDDRPSQLRYHAARAAALAAAGQGRDEPPPDEAARAKLRGQALAWLKAELTAWGEPLESGPAQDREFSVLKLNGWKQDAALASIRDAAALEKLPADEQKAFTRLWAEVAALLTRAETAAKKEALVGLRKAIELNPKAASAHDALGVALYRLDQVDEALVCFKKATELDPKYEWAHANLGIALV